MNKCIILILVVMVLFKGSNNSCLQNLAAGRFQRTFSGIDAFEWAYKNISLLSGYYAEIYTSATKDFQDKDLLSPSEWCNEKHAIDPNCKSNLMEGGYKISVMRNDTQLTSLEALEHSYRRLTTECLQTKNDQTKDYYEYILTAYNQILYTKRIRNPIEYCTGQLANGSPSNYAGHYFNLNTSNERTNIQDAGQNQNVGEGSSSRIPNVVVDDVNEEIDLNKPYNNRVQYTGIPNYILDINLSPKND